MCGIRGGAVQNRHPTSPDKYKKSFATIPTRNFFLDTRISVQFEMNNRELFKFNGFEKCKRKLNSSEQRSGAKSRLMTPSEFYVTFFRHLKPNRCIINHPFFVCCYLCNKDFMVSLSTINQLVKIYTVCLSSMT